MTNARCGRDAGMSDYLSGRSLQGSHGGVPTAAVMITSRQATLETVRNRADAAQPLVVSRNSASR